MVLGLSKHRLRKETFYLIFHLVDYVDILKLGRLCNNLAFIELQLLEPVEFCLAAIRTKAPTAWPQNGKLTTAKVMRTWTQMRT